MSELKKVVDLGVDLTGPSGNAYLNFVVADNTLISKIKSILGALGLYKPDADSAAKKLIPILQSKSLGFEFQELTEAQQLWVTSAVQSVMRVSSGKVQTDLGFAAKEFFKLASDEFSDESSKIKTELKKLNNEAERDLEAMKKAQEQRLENQNFGQTLAEGKAADSSCYTIDGGEVEEESAAAAKAAQEQDTDRIKRQQRSNARTLLFQLQNAYSQQSEFKFSNELANACNRYECPKMKMEEMINYLKTIDHLDRLYEILKGEITIDELLSGEIHLATVLTHRGLKEYPSS